LWKQLKVSKDWFDSSLNVENIGFGFRPFSCVFPKCMKLCLTAFMFYK